MKSSTKDQVEGTFHELKGKVKEVAGKLSDNPKLEAEGTGEKIAGKVQEKIGQVKKGWFVRFLVRCLSYSSGQSCFGVPFIAGLHWDAHPRMNQDLRLG